MAIVELVSQIARRVKGRSEATLQADIRQLLLVAPFSLSEGDLTIVDLETPVGIRRRIDIEAGSCLVEVKRDLTSPNVLSEAIAQLTDYLIARQSETGCRYVGMLTDGQEWKCFRLSSEPESNGPRLVSSFRLMPTKPDVEGFLVWLEGVLATSRDIPATPREIGRRLGDGSSAYALDRDTLLELYMRHKDHPAVLMKRRLWAKLLSTALGTQFEDSDDLFVEHTYLVNTAEIIAHAIVGFEVSSIAPISLLSGGKFEESGISGVVEADFFDWVSHVPGGESFVRALARRVARFNWKSVPGDVLKVLYESVITTNTRKRLGEYYTPDWLAECMVEEVIDAPLNQRVLDPACGSGTFLFHAVRRYLSAAEHAGLPLAEALKGLTSHVLGLDLHPVAVTLARVTYLLAIGSERLTRAERGQIHIPVYLGDAVQWRREADNLFSEGDLVIETDDKKSLFESELRFPSELLEDSLKFGQVVESLTTMASNRKAGSTTPRLAGLFQKYAIGPDLHQKLEQTFRTLCVLHDSGRDHIWSYYVRNLARPWWLALQQNRVDVIIGNPPWLAYRYMTPAMQETFRDYCEERGLWHGAKVATHQDLSGLFIVRAIERYLRIGGRFAFVMPNAAVDRGQFFGLRTGVYRRENADPVNVAFKPSWDLRRIRPHFFPRGAAVLFGGRSEIPVPLPTRLTAWKGRLLENNSSWKSVKKLLERTEATAQPVSELSNSPWSDRFRQGATIVPRLLFFVTRRETGPLGAARGKILVRSLKRANDKKPWKELPELEGVIESEFLRPILVGESILPFRIAETFEAIIPRDATGLMDGQSERLDAYEGLAKWWREAEVVWEQHRSSGRLSLLDQLNYQGKAEHQFPLQPERIVYNTSGMHLVAARVVNHRLIVDSSVYWATAGSTTEAHYLCAILNSAKFTELVRPYMSYGKDERHFHKHIWQLSVPLFERANDLHVQLASRGAALELTVSHETLRDTHFSAVRRDLRAMIAASDEGKEVELLVEELLAD